MIGGARPATVFWRFRNRGRIMFEQAKAADVSGRCWAYLMTKMLTLALAGSAVASVAKTALCAPSLQATALYKDTAHGCRALDMKSWSHPTRKVLECSKIEIKKVELCNQDVYPIYTVRFDASPMLGVNDKHFNKLYVEMAAANGL